LIPELGGLEKIVTNIIKTEKLTYFFKAPHEFGKLKHVVRQKTRQKGERVGSHFRADKKDQNSIREKEGDLTPSQTPGRETWVRRTEWGN